jgi:uncharacterized membrane protein YphA (DoxX/SURF4 family)
MISLGVLILVFGYGVLLFAPPPTAWIPLLRQAGYASGVIMLATGAGLFFERSTVAAVRALLPFLTLWTLSRVPVVILDPGREISWFAIGEICVLAAAALVLFTRLVPLTETSPLHRATRVNGLRVARVLFALSLVTFGLSHFFEFAAHTVSLVPSWLPYREGWADLTGAAQIVAGVGVLFSVFPRWAATMEAVMMSAFTLLVWVPVVVANPRLPSNWVEFLFTFALAGASWVMADSLPTTVSAPRATPAYVKIG